VKGRGKKIDAKVDAKKGDGGWWVVVVVVGISREKSQSTARRISSEQLPIFPSHPY
jgi:hypothetical protein